MSHESVFTCVTCNVAFNTFELQRDHYKTDWHRYNLKRKIAELPSVSHKEFQERLSIQKAQVDTLILTDHF
jgi:pre-60S factor REI1